MNIRDEIRNKIQEVAVGIAGKTALLRYTVEVPDHAERGDYATNIAMTLAQPLGRAPMDIAEELASMLADERWVVSVAAPGFLNFTFSDTYLADMLIWAEQKGAEWGTNTAGADSTVVVEYFQLNIAKRPHIGHLRSAVIGDALKRMFASQGYCAVSDTHVGDWGTQFGIVLLGYKEWKAEQQKETITADPFALLEEIYAEENKRIDAEPERREQAKEEFAKLERGDSENRALWEWMVDVSMQKLTSSANRLGLLPFDEHKGESSYEAAMPGVVIEALQKGIAERAADGAVVVNLTKEKLDEAVLVKSDGASTYVLRDLATIQYRAERWGFQKNLYVVDTRQAHHFRQVFRVAELLGYKGAHTAGMSAHVDFGFLKLPEGAMSTRKGTALSLDALLDEAEHRAAQVITEKNPNLKDAADTARQIGVGAVKYFDLSHSRKSDIIFEWNKALSFEGNTGPYIQYTHARLKSILRKMPSMAGKPFCSALADVEHRLCAAVLRYPSVIEDALQDYSPHILAAYMYGLAAVINEFYHALPVIAENDAHKRAFRALLVSASAQTLKNGLYLLGIEAPEEM